ncbi:hydroxysqualene dehydroxylase HpnE [Vogesella indigofera]|uniref:hydroxysqualene dehydroxylase HpnE n=1 Tax=Vogesella indigofera TaxID=45465 RepID=UPI00234F0541|nr:hydroxysqualene dehydroxylase HpnE [Vogesella indigofera]MDC7698546.1 hydroxysqualene dehydroxylase HpnE [Vogesella indigofera]
MKPRVAVIGAGWAGLAAAITLAPAANVVLFEAGKIAGGRARRVPLDGMALDNGQHILIGAYRESLRLMRQVGVDPAQALASQPLRWHQVDGVQLHCPDWPAPWHMLAGLCRARGLGWRDKLALARLLTQLRVRRWRIGHDVAALDWLRQRGQSQALLDGFWTPLILATLNTPPAQASMQLLANVLRDSLGAAQANASRLLLPRTDLSALFAEPALQWLTGAGAQLRLGHRVRHIDWHAPRPRVDGDAFDAVLIATAPYHAASLAADEKLSAMLKAWQYQPISTLYLRFEGRVRLPQAMTGLQHGIGQWWFDREALTGEAGLVAVVISAAGEHDTLSRAALTARVLAELQQHVPDLPPLTASWQITEQRATFAANVGLARPALRLGVKSGYLAGDWLCADYPATLEGAVRSGIASAHALMQDWKKEHDANV